MSIEKKDISNFYDSYTVRQNKSGVNTRHRIIMQRLKKAGLKDTHKILEVGCGIGTLTGLLAKYCSSGSVLAVDISPKSIEVAKYTYGSFKNLSFLLSDMSDFKSEIKFDFIVLPDVLEHIPLEQHKQLFHTLSQNLSSNGKIAINIPHPHYLEWAHINRPDLLQIIDQPLHTNLLVPNIYGAGLFIQKLESYSISTNPEDYQWIIVKHPEKTNYAEKSPSSRLFKSLVSRM